MGSSTHTSRFVIVAVLVCGVLLWFLLSLTLVAVGYVGVEVCLGRVSETPMESGVHLTRHPLCYVVQFSTQTVLIEMNEDIPTKEGMTVHLEAAALIRLRPEAAPVVLRTIGAHFRETIVIPSFRSVVRSVSSGHEAKDLYTSTTRDTMSTDLERGLTELVSKRGITIENVLLKRLTLPPTLQDAIQLKMAAEQEAQRMQFVLQRERMEAERKAIEAEGIARFQHIVAGNITDGILRWKGIEATEQLARSDNAKIILMGHGTKDGLPVLLNDAPSSTGAHPAPTSKSK